MPAAPATPATPPSRVINHPDHVVEDMLAGWLLAHREIRASAGNPRVLRHCAVPQRGRVGIVSGGGSGHEPAFLGYLGPGLLDAVAVGEIFSSPTARSFADALRAADGGAGVACLYGNYAGDNMNVALAVEMLAREGVAVQTVVANDDVASAARGQEARRRGVAGEILMWKVAAARAAAGAPLAAVCAAAHKALAHTRSMGIGLSACVIPAVGKANFQIAPGTMELGIGHHGEPGIEVRAAVGAAEMAELLLAALLPELPFGSGDGAGARVALLLSGLGATPLMEQYILYGEIARRLQARGIAIAFRRVGNLFSSLDMMGVTLTLMLLDDELAACLAAPCASLGLQVAGDPQAADPAQTAPARPMPIPAPAPVPAPQVPAASDAAAQAAAPAACAFPETRPAAADAGSQTAPPAPGTAGAALDMALCGGLVRELIAAVQENRQRLSEIDGLIGDGDHGINMHKGFGACAARLDAMAPAAALQLPRALEQLAQALLDDIGGSMGPLYGGFFSALAATLAPHARLDAALFGQALAAAAANVQRIGGAQVGDKTLIDSLAPACAAYQQALADGLGFAQALAAMARAAQSGMESTRALQARLGRAARLGARSIGVPDAGASSCCLLLQTMARALQRRLGAPGP